MERQAKWRQKIVESSSEVRRKTAVAVLVDGLISQIPLAYLRMIIRSFSVPNVYIWNIKARTTTIPEASMIPWPIGFLMGSFSKKFIPRGEPRQLLSKLHRGLSQWRNRVCWTAHFTEAMEEEDSEVVGNPWRSLRSKLDTPICSVESGRTGRLASQVSRQVNELAVKFQHELFRESRKVSPVQKLLKFC